MQFISLLKPRVPWNATFTSGSAPTLEGRLGGGSGTRAAFPARRWRADWAADPGARLRVPLRRLDSHTVPVEAAARRKRRCKLRNPSLKTTTVVEQLVVGVQRPISGPIVRFGAGRLTSGRGKMI